MTSLEGGCDFSVGKFVKSLRGCDISVGKVVTSLRGCDVSGRRL